MRTCLIAVNIQNDLLPGGAMAVPDGNLIIDPISKLAKEMDLVVVSRDWHPKQHSSFKPFGGLLPSHCVQETQGARMPSKIRKPAQYVISMGIEKQAECFSAFAGQTLRPKRMLHEILVGHEIERVIVGGLALDLAVQWTALDAAAYGFVTIVGLDITKPLTVEGEMAALEMFRTAGVQVQSVAG